MRRRLLALGVVVAAAAGLAVVLVATRGGNDPPKTLTPGAGNTETTVDPIAWSPMRRRQLERRAAAGLSHVIYAKSPGGAIASAARTAAWRPRLERGGGRPPPRPGARGGVAAARRARGAPRARRPGRARGDRHARERRAAGRAGVERPRRRGRP